MSAPVVVLGIDGSPGSVAAVAWTARFAAATRVSVVAVHAYNAIDALAAQHGASDLTQLHEITAERAREVYAAPLRDAGVDLQVRVVDDAPIPALTSVALEVGADLVVVGSHGHEGWRDRVFGSVARDLPHMAACPVAVVPVPRG